MFNSPSSQLPTQNIEFFVLLGCGLWVANHQTISHAFNQPNHRTDSWLSYLGNLPVHNFQTFKLKLFQLKLIIDLVEPAILFYSNLMCRLRPHPLPTNLNKKKTDRLHFQNWWTLVATSSKARQCFSTENTLVHGSLHCHQRRQRPTDQLKQKKKSTVNKHKNQRRKKLVAPTVRHQLFLSLFFCVFFGSFLSSKHKINRFSFNVYHFVLNSNLHFTIYK